MRDWGCPQVRFRRTWGASGGTLFGRAPVVLDSTRCGGAFTGEVRLSTPWSDRLARDAGNDRWGVRDLPGGSVWRGDRTDGGGALRGPVAPPTSPSGVRTGPFSRRRHPRSYARANSWGGALGAAAAVLVIAVLLAASTGAVSASSATPTLHLRLGPAVAQPTDFWGLDLLADKNPGPDPAHFIGETPTKVLVYPEANVTERLNLTSGVLYGVGSTSKANIPIRQFITDCQAIACHAIIGLPMEINSSSTDAYEASYIVNTLHFSPEYFLYGNEPAHWYCFGISWAQLAAGHPCNTGNTTVTAFANETEAAIQAVTAALGGHHVPPAMCLGGSGQQGAGPEIKWIQALEANVYDQAACAAYAMHAHPAHSQTVTPTLANFYATLTGPEGMTAGYQNASNATEGKPLYMTEVGVFTRHSVFNPVFMGTWAMDVFESALVVQSMQNRLPDMGWWAWALGSKDALYNGGTTTFYSIYTQLFTKLGTTWHASQLEGQQGIYAEATQTGSAWSLLVVSTNITQTFHLVLRGSGFPHSGCGMGYTWTSTGEVTRSLCNLVSGFNVAPQSVVLVTI